MSNATKFFFIIEPGNTSPVDGEFFETADALHQLMAAMDGVYAVYEFDAINPQKTEDVTDQALYDFSLSSHAPRRHSQDDRDDYGDYLHDQQQDRLLDGRLG